MEFLGFMGPQKQRSSARKLPRPWHVGLQDGALFLHKGVYKGTQTPRKGNKGTTGHPRYSPSRKTQGA